MLREAKGNMFDFLDYTFNSIKGRCPHKCNYCYMKTFWGTDITINRKAFKNDLPENNKIFVGTGTDMWAYEVLEQHITETLDFLKQYNNTYLFQTKNPVRFLEFIEQMPKNVILGTTIETDQQELIESEAPTVENRVKAMKKIKQLYPNTKTTITLEPVIDFNLDKIEKFINDIRPDYIYIGAVTKFSVKKEPAKDKINALINRLQKKTNVNLKHNLNRLLK